MPAEAGQKVRSETLNLFQYVQRLREEIGRLTQQPDGQTRFETKSDQLDAIPTSNMGLFGNPRVNLPKNRG